MLEAHSDLNAVQSLLDVLQIVCDLAEKASWWIRATCWISQDFLVDLQVKAD